MAKLKNISLLLLLNLLCSSMIKSTYADQEEFEETDDFGDFDNEEDSGFNNKNVPVIDIEDLTSEIDVEEEQDTFDQQEDQFVDSEDEATVEAEDEFSHLEDEDEFIGFSSEGGSSSSSSNGRGSPTRKEAVKEPRITIANVPLHLRSNWDSFYLELILFSVLLVYFTNFSVGRTKNYKLAMTWFETHKSFLLQQFALVGDDLKALTNTENSNGTAPETKSVITNSGGCAGLQKESENIYTLYCSGRVSVHSMTVELRFLKRQDLASLITHIFKPSNDEVIIKIRLDDMDNFVMCLAAKKVATKYAKEMGDLSTYCPGDRKTTLPTKQYTSSLASKFVVWSEIGEASQAMLGDLKVSTILSKNLHRINYLHISDQYAGPKMVDQNTENRDQQQVEDHSSSIQKMPEVHKMIILSLQLNGKDKEKGTTEDIESLKPLMMIALHLADKISRFRLTKEAKAKAVKNRSKMEETFHKANHLARAERAQGLREERKREAREKIMECDDPEKQRKWEEKENKKAAKKRVPKMKQLKVV